MSLPLTVAWKYQSFHVCGGEEGMAQRGEAVAVAVDSSPALYAPFQLFAQMAENEK